MKKRILSFMLVSVMMATALIGCGNSGGGSQSSSGSKTDTPSGGSTGETTEAISGEIRHAFWDAAQQPYLEACAAAFKEEYPDVNIVFEPNTWDDYWTKLEAAATGGSMADVFWMNGPNIAKYAKGGILMSAEDLISKYGLNTADYPAGLVDLYNIDGVQYGLPKDFDTIGLWYNKKLFDEAGVDYPTDDWTFEDMQAAAKALTKADGSVYGMVAGFDTQSGYYSPVYAAGGKIISDDKKTSGYSDPATQKGIELWASFIKDGTSPSQASIEETTANIQFLNGAAAMSFQGSWFLAQVVDADIKGDIDVVELPSIDGKKGTVIHGLANCIYANTPNPDAAQAWVAFLAGPKANQLSAEMGAAIPALAGTADAWVNAHPEYNLKSYIKSAQEYSYAYPASINTGEWNQYEGDELKKVFTGETDVKTACDALAAKMNEVLANE